MASIGYHYGSGNTCHSSRRLHKEVDTGGARPVPVQRHRLGVAAEVGDVLLDPLEGRDLVHQAVVGHLRVLMGRRVGVEEAEDPEPVVDGDHHHIAVAGQHPAVVEVAWAPAVGFPVDKQHHWQQGPVWR